VGINKHDAKKMKRLLIYLFVFAAMEYTAQQTLMYTQYTFNKGGMNPAASGSEINTKYYYIFGVNRQWVEFDNAPKQNFVNFSYTIRQPRSVSFWQNAGIYVDNDQTGLLGNNGGYLTYAAHFLLRKKITLSFGVFAGVRKFTRSLGRFDENDPVVGKTSSLLLYPDVIPGARLSNTKFFMDLSVRQVTITKLQDFKGRRIGKNSRLQPTIYYCYGRKFPLMENLLMMPSMAVNMPVIGPPIFDMSLMFYYANRVGAGVSLRNASFASGIVQIRFLESMTVGFAYSYPVNLTRYGSGNSYEIIVGVVPAGMSDKVYGRNSIARCPILNY
jgi:type IX secretion system PorP/SprF family membrane protein